MGSEFLTPDNLWQLSIIVPVDAAMGSEFLTRDNLWKLSIIVPEQQLGSEFMTPDKSEELSFIVPMQKWLQNFWPLTNQRNCPL